MSASDTAATIRVSCGSLDICSLSEGAKSKILELGDEREDSILHEDDYVVLGIGDGIILQLKQVVNSYSGY